MKPVSAVAQQSEALGHDTSDADVPPGRTCSLQAEPPSAVAKTTAPFVELLAATKHSEALGHEIPSTLVTSDDTLCSLQVDPPSVVARISG
jgi:hypothetical protein